MVEPGNRGWGSIRTMHKVLITAGASGIGREMVHAFTAAGAKVAVIDIDTALLATLHVAHPAVITETCDLAERKQVENVVPRVIAALGGLDVLINNAGIAGATT